MAQALCESKPEVGSSKNNRSFGWCLGQRMNWLTLKIELTLAANSTAIVKRFLCSTPSELTTTSAEVCNPHITKHLSTLSRTHQQQSATTESLVPTMLVSLPLARIGVVVERQRKEQPHARSTLVREYPSVDSIQFVLENPQVTAGRSRTDPL